MRTLVFNIQPEGLVWKNWIEWCTFEEEDFHYILSLRNKHNLTTGTSERKFDIVGSHEGLFHFLHDLALKYDIEII